MRIILKPIVLLVSLTLLIGSCSRKLVKTQLAQSSILKDGLYPILRSAREGSHLLPLQSPEALIRFNHKFVDRTAQMEHFMVVDKMDFVPLRLSEQPSTIQQPDGFKKLMLQLDDRASQQLAFFTESYINRRVAIVLGGEAVSVHKVKAVIQNGLLQISRCTDNACEYLYYELRDN